MSITCWKPKNINCKFPINKKTKCEDILCSMIKTIEVIGVAGINYLVKNPGNFEKLSENTEASLNQILNGCDNCVIKDCTIVLCCISTSIGVIGAAGTTAIARQPEEYDEITDYTNLLINAMYSKVNCLNKNVNCTDIQCCIAQAIGVIEFSLGISMDPKDEELLKYVDYLKVQITINCK